MDVPVSVRAANLPSSVSLEPTGEALKFTRQDGYVHARVTVLTGHVMLVLRFG